MTRGAKAVALDDLSFWHRILPALQHFHRIMPDFEREYGMPVGLPYDAATLTVISDASLRLLERPNTDSESALGCVPTGTLPALRQPPAEDRLDMALRRLKGAEGDQSRPDNAGEQWSLVLAMEAIRVVVSIGQAADVSGLAGTPQTEVSVPGCGEVEAASIDIVWGDALLEMKVTKSPQTTRDLRQVLMYAGLRLIGNESPPLRIGLVNPRRGWLMLVELSELLTLCGGLSLADYRDELAAHLQMPARSN